MNDEDLDFGAGVDSMAQEQKQQPAQQPQPRAIDFGNAVESMAQERDQQQAARISTVLGAASDQNPDQAAKAAQLSRATGLPLDLVNRNLDDVAKRQRIESLDLPNMARSNPVLAQRLADPQFAGLAHDDIENLSAIEESLRFGKNTASALLAGVYGFGEGILGVPEAGAGAISQYITGPLADLGILPEDSGARVEQGIREFRRGQTALRERFMPQVQQGEDVPAGFYSGLASLSQNLLILPFAVATDNPAMALNTMAATAGGQTYARSRDIGANVGPALTNAITQGLIEYGTEKLPMGYLLKDLKQGAPFWQTLGRQVLAEIPGEQIATALQDASDWAELNPTKTVSEYLQERPSAAMQTLVATLVGAGGQVSVLKGVEALANRNATHAANAAQSAQYIGKLAELAKASGVLRRAPDDFRAFLKDAMEQGPVDALFFDAALLMQSGIGDQLAALSPSVAEQLPIAAATGGQVSIPLDEFMTNVAPTDLSAQLIEHARTEPDGYSLAEAEAYLQSNAAEMDAMVQAAMQDDEGRDQFKASQEEVRQHVLQQLNALDRFRSSVNELYAALHSSYAAVRAAQMGMTPMEFYRDRMLTIAGGGILPTDRDALHQAENLGIAEGAPVVSAAAPTKTVKAYKLFRVDPRQPGRLFPLFVNANQAVPIGEWIDAEVGPMTGNKVKSKLGPLAFRPGWHAGDIPVATHIGGKSSPGQGPPDYRPSNQVWAEVEMPDDVDWQAEANRRGLNKKGDVVPVKAHITDQIPVGGHYRYKTNPNMTGNWLIGGSMKVLRVLRDEEVAAINAAAGVSDLPRQEPSLWETGGGQFNQAGDIETPEFHRWFGDSKVVDESGNPLRVYHGTGVNVGNRGEFMSGDFDVFDGRLSGKSSKTGAPSGAFFFTDSPEVASSYTVQWRGDFSEKYKDRANVMPVFLSIKKPLKVSAKGNGWREIQYKGQELDVNELVAIAKASGKYDGVIVTRVLDHGVGKTSGKPATTYVAFEPTQIKSAIGNSGAFDPNDPSILRQSSKPKALIFQHNLSGENLLHADRMGGIPIPSLAVTKADHPLTGFGEITLLGDADLADPRGYAKTQVFGADIYSPRYPRVSYQFTDNMAKRADKELAAAYEATKSSIYWSDMDEGPKSLEKTPAIRWQFLKSKGIEPTIVHVQTPNISDELMPFVEGDLLPYQLQDDPAFIQVALDLHDQMERLRGTPEDEIQAERQQELDKIAEGKSSRIVRSYAMDIDPYRRKLGAAGTIDTPATNRAMEQQIYDGNLRDEFEGYVAEFVQKIGPNERIFQGYTNSGNRRYIAHTIDNVIRILKKELRGGEGFNYGVGTIRAAFTPQFKSIKAIRDASDRLMTSDDFEKVKAEIDAELIQLTTELQPYHPDSDRFGFMDTVASTLYDAAKMGLPRAMRENGFEDVPPEAVEQARDFLAKLRDLPTEYFEAKIMRAVELSEFKGAVVPHDARPEVLAALAKHGITNTITYQRGDEADRKKQIKALSTQADLLFQNRTGPRGAYNPATNTIALLKNADLSTFLHESAHYFFENDIGLAEHLLDQAEQFGADALSDGEKQILADVQALMNWHQIPGDLREQLGQWVNMDVEERRAYHEKTAESFERYLLEGKAPSLGLARAFANFRAWMLNVYKGLKNFLLRNPAAGELSDEVRQVFDRMLATTEEIQLAEQARSMMPLLALANQAGIDPADIERIHAMGLEATNSAIDELQAKALRDLRWYRNARQRKIGKMNSEARERRRAIRSEVAPEVWSQPVYQAWAFLTRKMSDDDQLPPLRPAGDPNVVDPKRDSLLTAIAKLGGLDKAEVVATWGTDPAYRPNSKVFGKPVWRTESGGRSIDAMAEALGEQYYLTRDEHGKVDLREFEELFDDAIRGKPVYGLAYEPEEESVAGEQIRNPAALGAGRLDRADLMDRESLTLEDVEKLSKLRMVRNTGLSADIVAPMFGFDSGDALLHALLEAEPPRDQIERLTDARMLQEFGELSSPEAIAEAADRAIHNDMRGRAIAAEMQALNKASKVTQGKGAKQIDLIPQAAREFAREAIGRLRVRDIRPGQYASAEARAAKAAATASAKGDVEQAIAEKRNQIVQHYMAKAAWDGREEVAKMLAYFRRVQKPGNIPADDFEQIEALLEKFDLRQISDKQRDRRARFSTWVRAQLNQGNMPPNAEALLSAAQRDQFNAELERTDSNGALIYGDEEQQAELLASFIDAAAPRHYRDVPLEELRGLYDTIKQIEHVGKRKQTMLTDRKERQYAALLAQMRQRLVDVATTRDRKAGDIISPNTAAGKLKVKAAAFFNSHIKVATLVNIMDGGMEGGPLWESLIMPANVASDEEMVDIAESQKAVRALFDEMNKARKAAGLKEVGRDKATRAELIPDRSFNHQARLVMALNMGNASNLQRLLGGYGWTIQQVQAETAKLTAADWAFVQGLWDHFETLKPRVGAMARLIDGKEPEWIEPVSFSVKTADNQVLNLRGGYAPIVFDPRASGQAATHADERQSKELLRAARVASTVAKSFLKERVKQVKGRPLLLSIDGMIGSMQDSIHYLHWQPWIIDANRIIRDLDPEIREYYGHEAVKILRDWAAANAAGLGPVRDGAEAIFPFLARNLSFAGLAFNVLSAAKQVTGFTQSMALIGTKWMRAGMFKMLADGPKASYQEALEKSLFLQKRSSTRMKELHEVTARIQGQSQAETRWRELGYVPMMFMQSLVDLPTWWGAYLKAQDAGEDEAKSVALADQAVKSAQGSGLMTDRASVERTQGAMRLLTAFAFFTINTANMNYRTIKSDEAIAAKAWDLFLINTVPVLFTILLTNALVPGDGDDDYGEKFLEDQISFLLGQFVALREIAPIMAAFDGKPSGDYGGPSGLRWAESVLTFAKQVGQGEWDLAMVKAAIEAFGSFLPAPIPSAQINRSLGGLAALADGKTVNPAAVVLGYQKPH